MFVIAITGLPGSGKSTICHLLEKQYSVISMDDITHEQYQKNHQGFMELHKLLGDGILSGNKAAIDRERLRTIYFFKKKYQKKIDAVIQPVLYSALKNRLEDLKNKQNIVIVEIPLFFKYLTIYKPIVDTVIIIKRDYKFIIPIIKKKFNWTEKLACKYVEKEQKHYRKDFGEKQIIVDNNKNIAKAAELISQSINKFL